MDNIHSCPRCELILVDAESTDTYQKCYELSLLEFLDYATGPDPCQFFTILFAICQWPTGYFENAKSTSRIALQYDSQIDSSFSLSLATLPRKQKPVTSDTGEYYSTASRYGELGQFDCQRVTDSDGMAATDVPGRILPSTFDASTVAMIQSWYSDCRSHHADCQRGSMIPRRLLYVGDNDDERLRLMEFEEHSLTGQVEYAALSYIWGGPQKFQTFKDNIATRMSAIEMDSLPQTLKDAVLTCRKLQFRYLWVDVLCIIQDSPYDKAEQISMMDNIFRSAAVTLIAATALNSDSGFLSDTFDNAISPLVRCRYKTGVEGSVCLIRKRNGQARFPIESRGWTMQERLLSSRLLVFHTGRIDWVCQHDHLFAGCSSSYSVNLITESLIRSRTWDEFDLSSTTALVSVQDQIRQWYSLCDAFSKRQLTDPADCLPAISGIAREFQYLFPDVDEYVAGMWRANLAQQLLWRKWGDVSLTHKHKSYIAPSWSWASTRGDFILPTFADAPADVRLKIVDVEVHPTHKDDRFGQLSGAQMRVQGRLKSASWNILKQTIHATDGLSLLGNTLTLADTSEYSDSGPLADTELQVYCLEIQDARHWVRHFKTSWGPAFTGLLLLPRQGTLMTFERVGLFCLAKVEENEVDYAVVEAAVKNLAWFEGATAEEITLV